MKAIKRIFVGCFLLVVLAVIAVVMTAGYLVSLGPPEQHREVSTKSQEIDTPRLSWPASEADEDVGLPPLSLEVHLDLSEGEFEILPGNPGDGIRIEADYDAGIYNLEQKHELAEAEDGVERVAIRFYSKYSLLRRLVTMGGVEPDNRIKIYLPPDIPTKLDCDIRIAESNLDLSGLPLTGVDLNLTMGDHEVRFEAPNPLAMAKLKIYASKGEFTVIGLGNAGFQSATVQGSMGEVSLDLRGEYTRDASVLTRFRMGELRITVPEDIHLDVAPSTVMMGERRSSVSEGENIPDDAPTLTLQTSVSMGELSIRSE